MSRAEEKRQGSRGSGEGRGGQGLPGQPSFCAAVVVFSLKAFEKLIKTLTPQGPLRTHFSD